jgi:hypothetical protein
VRWSSDLTRSVDALYATLAKRILSEISQGTLAQRPTADGSMRFYFATDSPGTLYYDVGSWIPVTGTGSLPPATDTQDGFLTAVDHANLLFKDGSRALTADWNAGNKYIHSKNSTLWLNVRAFGAVGDNTADDTSALQACLDAASAAGGFYKYVTVYLPHGAYKVTSTLIYIPTTAGRSLQILGAGSYATAIVANGTGFGPSVPVVQIGDSTHFVHVYIKGVIVNGNPTAAIAGTVSATNGSTAVVGSGTNFTSAMVGKMIAITNGGYALYRVASVTDPTHLALTQLYQQATTSGLAYQVISGLNSAAGQSYSWRLYDLGGSYYEDFGAWYMDTGAKWEALGDNASVFASQFAQCNIGIDGRVNSGLGMTVNGLSFFGGDNLSCYEGFNFDDVATLKTNLNFYGVHCGGPPFGGLIWKLKNVQGFNINGCHTDAGGGFQTGRIADISDSSAGAIIGNYWTKSGASTVSGYLTFAGVTDTVILANQFVAGAAADSGIVFDSACKRNLVGPNGGLNTTFTTPVFDSNTNVDADANLYLGVKNPFGTGSRVGPLATSGQYDARRSRTTNLSLTSGAYTLIPFDDVSATNFNYDVGGISTATTTWTVPTGGAGRYYLACQGVFGVSAAGRREMAFTVNDSGPTVLRIWANATNLNGADSPIVHAEGELDLAAGDVVRCYARQDSGGALNLLGQGAGATPYTWAVVRRLG